MYKIVYAVEEYTIKCIGLYFWDIAMLERKEILNRISQLMEEKGVSSYKLKQNADVSTTINQWRKNPTREKNRVPSLRSIEKICEFFDISLSYFFAFEHAEQISTRTRELSAEIENLKDSQIAVIEKIVKEFKTNNE